MPRSRDGKFLADRISWMQVYVYLAYIGARPGTAATYAPLVISGLFQRQRPDIKVSLGRIYNRRDVIARKQKRGRERRRRVAVTLTVTLTLSADFHGL